jgi:hypothetical protein
MSQPRTRCMICRQDAVPGRSRCREHLRGVCLRESWLPASPRIVKLGQIRR